MIRRLAYGVVLGPRTRLYGNLHGKADMRKDLNRKMSWSVVFVV